MLGVAPSNDNAASPLERVLAVAGPTKKNGRGYLACCPAHGDRSPSLSITTGDDGRVLIKCFAGCTVESIVAAWGIELTDLFPPRSTDVRPKALARPVPPTLAELAAHKRLPVDVLASFGWRDEPHYIAIPYCRRDGSVHRTRMRVALSAKDGSRWANDGQGQIAYEPDRGALASQESYVVLVEGETDTVTLLYAGFPALGIPGANATHCIDAHHLERIERVYISREPDQGGDAFVAGVRERLRELGFTGEVFELSMSGAAKDPSALFQRDPDAFPAAFGEALRAAALPPKPDLVTLGSLLGPAIERMERRRCGDETPIPVPWRDYAEQLGGGLWPGAHYITSGTGVGKSQFTLQISMGAARSGVPVAYIGLELEELQIAARVLGDQTGTRWSDLYLGRCGEGRLTDARAAVPALEGLPFYCEFSNARGWPISRLAAICESMRRSYPQGPLLVALDYLQLIGDEPDSPQRRPEARERIGAAAMAARDVARRFDAAVVIISSAARAHYGLLASDGRDAGLASLHVAGRFAPVRTILRPHVLVGLGKESGETEYSGDSVTALLRWPSTLPSGETPIIAATAKNRSGGGHWCALAFNGGRFRDLHVERVDDLPEVTRQGGKGKPVDAEEMVERAVEAVRKAGSGVLKSRTAIADQMTGTKPKKLAAVAKAIEGGLIVETDGFSVRGDEGTYR